mgnify:CR=1 FL=1|tara:strand:+ start:387 stop:1565 length:1179 start_codon:yes stop_codon:yes gene_type:complete
MEKQKANKRLREIREELGLSKSNISGDFIAADLFNWKEDKETKKKYKVSKISNRTYASIEDGVSVNKKYFKWIAQLFSNKYKNNKTNTQVSVNDIVENNSDSNPKSFSTFLYKIKNVNDLSDIINNSFKYTDHGQERLGDITNYRKTFFNCSIKNENQILVEKLLNIAETFTDNTNRYEVLKLIENQEGDDEHTFEKDIEFLKIAADGNDALEQLSQKYNINLFVGLLKKIPIVDCDIENVDEDETKETEKIGNYKVFPIASTRNYLIYNFTDKIPLDTSEVSYQSEFTFKEIEKILNKEKIFVGYHGNRENIKDMDSHARDIKTNLMVRNIKLPFSLNKKNFTFSNMIDEEEFHFENYEEFKEAAEEDRKNEEENLYADTMIDMMKEDEID